MVRVLNVAEKPSVAKAISAILSERSSTTRTGFSQYNHCFDFKYTIEGQPCDMVFTSVTGHLMTMEFVDAKKDWRSSNPIEFFDAPLTRFVPEDKLPLKRTLEREARSCQWLILWLDCDREGENIAYEVIEVCLAVNPRLRVLRAHFSALIPRDIHQALRTLTPPDQKLSLAVEARQEIDFRIGVAFTRFQTTRLQDKFANIEQVVSYGPCQFPVLGFVMERWRKRESFVEEAFWKIEVQFKDGEDSATFSWSRVRLFDRLCCLVLYEMCVENPLATVISVHSKRTSKYRPLPLATVEFQKRASRFLRMSSQRAMEVAEDLYRKGFLSYPRTETDKFKEGTDLRALIETQTGHPRWGGYAQRLLDGGFRHPTEGKNDDNAHPPIHPTRAFNDPNPNSEEAKVYELVARHYLACCSENAEGQQTNVTIDVNGEQFVANGLMITARNYLDVYVYDKWQAKTIPVFTEGETFDPSGLLMSEGRTTAPPLLTEPDLIALMDQNGIGTDSTIAEHIATVQKREYVEVQGKYFLPTSLGIALTNGYDSMQLDLSKPTLRAHMEAEMKRICDGTRSKEEVVQACLDIMKQTFTTAYQNAFKLDDEVARYFPQRGSRGDVSAVTLVAEMSRCGQCGQLMDLKKPGGDSKMRYLFCDECCKSLTVPHNGDLTPHNHTCPICNYQVLMVTKPETGASHFVCPFCFNFPPAIGDIEQAAEGMMAAADGAAQFRCFNCTRADCALSGGTSSRPVRLCPGCKSASLTLRSSPTATGKSWYLKCRGANCKSSISLTCKQAQVTEQKCNECGGDTHLVHFIFSRGQVPPTVPLEYTGCLGGCDETLSDLFLDRSFQAPVQRPQARIQGAPANGGRGGFGGGAAGRGRAAGGIGGMAGMAGPRGGAAPRGGGARAAAGFQGYQEAKSDDDHDEDDWGDDGGGGGGGGDEGGGGGGRGRGRARASAKGKARAKSKAKAKAKAKSRSRKASEDGAEPPRSRAKRGRGAAATTKSKRGGKSYGSSDSSSGGVRCYTCHQPGHVSPDCPMKGGNGGSSRGSYSGGGGMGGGGGGTGGGGSANAVCFVCQTPGHYASSCPQRRQ